MLRCAIYTRKSTEEGLDQDFNSLDAQRESAEAFIKSQAAEGWKELPARIRHRGMREFLWELEGARRYVVSALRPTAR